jgi:hypothetical protein
MTQPEINALLTAKVAAMTPAQADARVLELYSAPDTSENQLELVKLLFGEDMSIGE